MEGKLNPEKKNKSKIKSYFFFLFKVEKSTQTISNGNKQIETTTKKVERMMRYRNLKLKLRTYKYCADNVNAFLIFFVLYHMRFKVKMVNWFVIVFVVVICLIFM